jgi:hypothetical protein
MKAISSGLQAGDSAISAGPCWYLGATIVATDGSSIKIWDSETTTTTNDTEIDYFKCTAEKLSECHILKNPIWCSKGISTVKSGTVSVIVWYAL